MVFSGIKWKEMVNMVIGQYQSRIADNGRISLPKKFREELGDHFIITQGYEGSLLIVPFNNWQTITAEITNKPFFIGETRDTTRYLLGNAGSVDLDEQGRFIIPTHLRKYGQLGKEVVFLGLGNYIEVWDKDCWIKYQSNLSENIEKIGRKLGELSNK